MGNSESQDGYKEMPDEKPGGWYGNATSRASNFTSGLTDSMQQGAGSLHQGLTRAGQNLGVVEKPRTVEDEVCEMCPKMSMHQRILGFCALCAVGYLLSILGSLVLFGGYTDRNIRKFAELYILGNLVALSATAFFVGPRNLCARMRANTRRIGTLIWLALMIAVFVCALLHSPLMILFVLMGLETLAGCWYAASYVPFGRKMVVSFCQVSLFRPCPTVCKPLADQV